MKLIVSSGRRCIDVMGRFVIWIVRDWFIAEKNISLQKKSTTQVNAQCTLEIQLVQCLNLMILEPSGL